ncbi:MAG: hypothetical protein HZB29_09340 [Nitrospinae bacterium]|nr:hypothetical protein [Nitrospinota bacterium]
MSKIFKKDEDLSHVREFKLAEFSRVAAPASPAAPAKGKGEFVRDFESQRGSSEFIPGGFDFDYQGGLRRDEILRRSMDEAEEIIRNANSNADGIRSAAREDGYQKGHADGYTAGLTEAKPVMDSFVNLVRELTEARGKFYAGAEEEMIHLTINIARTVIGAEITKDPSLVQKVILKAVQRLQSREEMIIRVNPKDLAEAEKSLPELRREVEDIEKVSFKGDALITRGGCMVETNIGSIDARLETQLEAVRESFLGALEESRMKEQMGGGANAEG